MKIKNKSLGFTLIELLATIIILAIILSISVPLIFNLVEFVKKEAFRATAYSIADSGRLLIANENEDQGYQEFYYLDGVQYNANEKLLDYTGDGPDTGKVILNERNKVVMAIHNGTYCATKSANVNTVTVTKTEPEDCKAYNIIKTDDPWEDIADDYDVPLEDLLDENDETDPESPTEGKDIKIPVAPEHHSSYSGDGGEPIYSKTYYTVGYVYSLVTFPFSYEYTIELEGLPIPASTVSLAAVTSNSVFENLIDFERYVVKKNMGEVIWPGEIPAEIDISQAKVFRDHAARNLNMTSDNVTVSCDPSKCYATVKAMVNDINDVNLKTIEGVGEVVYTPIKFTVNFYGGAVTYAYDYTGAPQVFTVPKTGNYKFELWGASGGGTEDQTTGSHRGLGGYATGTINLNAGQVLHVYVGGQGLYERSKAAAGGWNGGGSGGIHVDGDSGGGGGTDIRLVGGTWNEPTSLYSRIMVAGAGGGTDNSGDTPSSFNSGLDQSDDGSGGWGGGLIGGNAKVGTFRANTGGTQTFGTLGQGQNSLTTNDMGGAGGGYRGGIATNDHQGGGGGGSAFISGYPGCDAIDEAGVNTGQPNHFSGMVFTNSLMLSGNEVMPKPGGGTQTGHSGNGYARIIYMQ
ncbi:MAG: glycine rich domain-containing protein [Bacilli bacterium]|nr:glycine rich domain-containing protein [Bacilli bacterium]MDD3304905.1 glycine rich domain-containing protein [Bacilli bacterium]MDD4053495.1 glycine rich domain-containing protein [Bacilli bacterium]MDD4411530.1 glycine rich domain-containing protein [Bacilli bacterium]